MDIKKLSTEVSAAAQIQLADLPAIAQAGFRTIICNRPDGEQSNQPNYAAIEQAAVALGLTCHHLPITPGQFSTEQTQQFTQLLNQSPQPALLYCRSGSRCATLWALANVGKMPTATIIDTCAMAGYNVKSVLNPQAQAPQAVVTGTRYEVVIVGAGAAGIAVAASLRVRQPNIEIALIDPAQTHYYQPGWTMVGAGVFNSASTARSMAAVLPRGVRWINAAVATFEPEKNAVILADARVIHYQQLVVCPGLKLNWNGIEGLTDTLGKNGVTSNYRFDLAPYTWQLVQQLKGGKAIFTQPPMPIKCAGAPQKAMYLSADHWRRTQALKNIKIDFCNAGAVLFGVPDYVPALMNYVNAYGIQLNFGRTLTAIDGAAKRATFSQNQADGSKTSITQEFDMIHVVPPQTAPDFIRASPLADSVGWVDVNPQTLRHQRFENIFALGDCTNTTNAKTAAAARKQAPVVAHNVLALRGAVQGMAQYDGYGSCPLTVARGKIVLAEFLYGGKVAPSFPQWLINGTQPSTLAWYLKARVLPPLYWQGMFKGREWLAKPKLVA